MLLYDVVFASRCTSNHHRLAIDALRHLETGEAEGWRDFFLHHHQAYLEGAKAPDATFKDFKNHVLHVRDNYWGGALQAAAEWQRRTVRALAAQDWKQAAYNAGVMSHYVVDPIQPLHTGQTETENTIHRAVEQSFSKSYKTFQSIIENDLGGYPQVVATDEPDWLSALIKAGADAANQHYDTIIDHYDFKLGAKNPPLGLDQTLKDAIAPLVGLAAVTLARVLDRTIFESGVAPPKVPTGLDAFFASLDVPIRFIAGKLDDAKERALVQAMYAEFQKTGKVRATLPEDDREVRALHAAEVLNKPLSSLDAEWPREIGTAHGEGAPVREAPKKAKPKPAEEDAPAVQERAPDARLKREDAIVDAPSIGPKTAARLEAIGLKTVADLLDAGAEAAAQNLATRHITPPVIRDWQAQALLACSVPGLRGVDAQMLVVCGVRDTFTLAGQRPEALLDAIKTAMKSPAGKQQARNAAPPKLEAVKLWIETANQRVARPPAAPEAAPEEAREVAPSAATA